MDGYISKQTALDIITEEFNNHNIIGAGYIAIAIYEKKPADVAPVRHGRWIIEGKEYKGMTVSCTCCDYVRHLFGWGFSDLKRDLKVNYPYCNKCGGKMDEVVVKNGKH